MVTAETGVLSIVSAKPLMTASANQPDMKKMTIKQMEDAVWMQWERDRSVVIQSRQDVKIPVTIEGTFPSRK